MLSCSTVNSVVTKERIGWAVNSLKPFKSLGEDGFLPVLLQKGLVQLMPFLLSLFRYSLDTGYIPKSWRSVKVVFIPKSGKDTYAEPKSFRPISLMSFLSKVLEKLVDRYIRDEILSRSTSLLINLVSQQMAHCIVLFQELKKVSWTKILWWED